MPSKHWHAIRGALRQTWIPLAPLTIPGIALGGWIGWEFSLHHQFPIAEFLVPRLIYAPLLAITLVSALLWFLGARPARFLAVGGVVVGLSIAAGQLLGPKWQDGQDFGGGSLILRLNAPLSQEFHVEAGCSTDAAPGFLGLRSNAIRSVFSAQRINIGDEHVAVLIQPNAQNGGFALIRTPPSSLPTYVTIGPGSVEFTAGGDKTTGKATFVAVLLPGRDPPLGGDGPRRIRGSASWVCGHEPLGSQVQRGSR